MATGIRAINRADQPDPFAVEGDKELFDRIVADQERYAGDLRPAPNWDLGIGGQDGQGYFEAQQRGETVGSGGTGGGSYYDKFSTLRKMLNPLVGCTGMRQIDARTMDEYRTFLKGIDWLDILPAYFEEDGKMKDASAGLMITDLGSILDINTISAFLDPALHTYQILEVGGGYGRLAEVFYNQFGQGRIKYVLLDAVPASLMYSYLYLSKTLPTVRIGFYYNDDPLDLDRFDCYIMPSWHFDASLWQSKFDCCINIQSMQEMNQHHVDHYLRLFDQILKEGSGIAYISNEKDYIFRGDWNYPDTWQRLLETRTPRSWTRNSPTEVFKKTTTRTHDAENRLVDFIYALQLKDFDRLTEQTTAISNLRDGLKQKQEELSGLQATVSEQEQRGSALQAAVAASEQKASALRAALAGKEQEISGLRAALGENEQKVASLEATLREQKQRITHLESILSRAPFSLEEQTLVDAEEAVRRMDRYYLSQEPSELDRLFERTNKAYARLVAARLYLSQQRYPEAWAQLKTALKLDPGMLLSRQGIRILARLVIRPR